MKILRSSALILTLSLFGASALQAMKSTAVVELSLKDKQVLALVDAELAKAEKSLNKVRVLVKCVSPDGLALLQEEDPLVCQKYSACLDNSGLSALLELNRIDEEELKAAKREKISTQIEKLQKRKATLYEGGLDNGVFIDRWKEVSIVDKELTELEKALEMDLY